MWKSFAIVIKFIVTILRLKVNCILFSKSSFTLARYITSEHCKSIELSIIQRKRILLVIINAFKQSRN